MMKRALLAIAVLAGCVELVAPDPRGLQGALTILLDGTPDGDILNVTLAVAPGVTDAGMPREITPKVITIAGEQIPWQVEPFGGLAYRATFTPRADVLTSQIIEASWPSVASVDLPASSDIPFAWRQGPPVVFRNPGEDIHLAISLPAASSTADLDVDFWQLGVKAPGFSLAINSEEELPTSFVVPATALPAAVDSLDVGLTIIQRSLLRGVDYVIVIGVSTDISWRVITDTTNLDSGF